MRVGLFFGSFDPPHIGHVNVVMGATYKDIPEWHKGSVMTINSSWW